MFEYKNFWEMDAPEDSRLLDEYYIGCNHLVWRDKKRIERNKKKNQSCIANRSSV